jgi:hypothetical protein
LPASAVVSHTAGRGDDRTQGRAATTTNLLRVHLRFSVAVLPLLVDRFPRELSVSVSRLYSRLCRLRSARVHVQTKPGTHKLSQVANAFQGDKKGSATQGFAGQANTMGFQRGSAPLKATGGEDRGDWVVWSRAGRGPIVASDVADRAASSLVTKGRRDRPARVGIAASRPLH